MEKVFGLLLVTRTNTIIDFFADVDEDIFRFLLCLRLCPASPVLGY